MFVVCEKLVLCLRSAGPHSLRFGVVEPIMALIPVGCSVAVPSDVTPATLWPCLHVISYVVLLKCEPKETLIGPQTWIDVQIILDSWWLWDHILQNDLLFKTYKHLCSAR